MYSAKVVESEHKDLIHDVAFNWYGTHMATRSSDQTVKVWTQDSETNNWACTASWKCHSGAVWKITWAHPEFGQVGIKSQFQALPESDNNLLFRCWQPALLTDLLRYGRRCLEMSRPSRLAWWRHPHPPHMTLMPASAIGSERPLWSTLGPV